MDDETLERMLERIDDLEYDLRALSSGVDLLGSRVRGVERDMQAVENDIRDLEGRQK